MNFNQGPSQTIINLNIDNANNKGIPGNNLSAYAGSVLSKLNHRKKSVPL